MNADKFIAGLKIFDDPSASVEELASVFTELPAMRYAPRYDSGSLGRFLPAGGIGPVQSSGLGPIIVTPYSMGGGYMGQWSAEMEALQASGASVEAGNESADLIYFDEQRDYREFFDEALATIGVRADAREYAAVYMTYDQSAELTQNEQSVSEAAYPYYLEQLKLICPSAIEQYPKRFHQSCVEQELSIADALWAFCRFESAKFNPSNSLFPHELSGIIGGDGDFEREELAFGLLVEDKQAGVYRIWSRAALCTK